MRKNNIISEVFGYLKEIGLTSNECEFSEYWLGCSSGYVRSLRFTKREPSLGSIAVCASRLQKAGEQMVSTPRFRAVGTRFIALSEKCHELVNEDAVELDLAG
jgi:hypothetical protein